MDEQTIRKPKGPAIIFLITAISFVITILSTFILSQSELPNTEVDLPFIGILRVLIMAAANLFMSIILFSKKYNNALIVATATLLIYNIIGLFLNVTPFVIFDILFYLLLIAYTYVAINKQRTQIREKVVKSRFVIPLFQFCLILYSVIQTLQSNYERALETVSSYPEGTISIFEILSPYIISSIISFLPVLCYIWHVNWLADPYEKTESISTDNQL